jgi:hypothetical protein
LIEVVPAEDCAGVEQRGRFSGRSTHCKSISRTG